MAKSDSLERPRFFAGKFLTAEDLALEQSYFLDKLRRHNRSLHGFGIVSGLKVTTGSGQIAVDAGMALDCQGNEIVIRNVQIVSLPSIDTWRTAYVNVSYAEDNRGPSTVTGDSAEASTLRESFEITIDAENYNSGHRHLRARWLACGEPHALTIAKLKHSSQGWKVDRGYRPPQVK